MLEDEEWTQWSGREVAKRCGVNPSTISRIRSSLLQCNSEDASPNRRTYKTKHGTVTRMKTGNINRSRKRGADSPNPIRQPRPVLARTSLPHDPVCGARAIVSALGIDYAHRLIQTLTNYLQHQKAGDP